MFTLTAAVVTFWDLSIVREARVFKAFKILLNRSRPALAEICTLGFGAEVETNHVLAVQLALKIDNAKTFADRFFLETKHISSTMPKRRRGQVSVLTIAMR